MSSLDRSLVFSPSNRQRPRAKCPSCADIAALGQAMVYGQPMGFVARCGNCDNVLIVIVERAGQKSLNMRGLRWLRVADPVEHNRI